jgi:hypothetical protein
LLSGSTLFSRFDSCVYTLLSLGYVPADLRDGKGRPAVERHHHHLDLVESLEHELRVSSLKLGELATQLSTHGLVVGPAQATSHTLDQLAGHHGSDWIGSYR